MGDVQIHKTVTQYDNLTDCFFFFISSSNGRQNIKKQRYTFAMYKNYMP